LGASTFDRPVDGGWERCLLVESAQSMANRLESTLWNDAADEPDPVIAVLPYVRIVNAEGDYLTSSRTESHRLASPYVRKAELDGEAVRALTVSRLGLAETTPLDYPAMARALMSLDPMVLVHGVFFAGSGKNDAYPGQPKFARVLSGFIEASDVRAAESGGVKRDHVSHTQAESGGDSTEGYGSVPFSRTEWTARSIMASFNIDLAQLRSYGLPEPAEMLLTAIAHLEVRRLLDGSLRLRTNCDLEVLSDEVTDRAGVALPPAEALEDEVSKLCQRCGDDGLLGTGVVEAVWTPAK
jgi:CRISPR-associated protein Csb1